VGFLRQLVVLWILAQKGGSIPGLKDNPDRKEVVSVARSDKSSNDLVEQATQVILAEATEHFLHSLARGRKREVPWALDLSDGHQPAISFLLKIDLARIVTVCNE